MLLIHGFHTTERAARLDLHNFRTAIADFAPALAKSIFIVTWPGNSLGGPAAYPWMIGNARSAAPVLRRGIESWYEQQDGPKVLTLVAHSLGCRLTLEALASLDRSKLRKLERLDVFLMAAAVPVGLQKLINDAQKVATSITVLCSAADEVLRIAFPLGETFAGEGWMPRAVGRFGEPWGMSWFAVRNMRGFNHGDYWRDHLAPAVISGFMHHLSPNLVIRGLPRDRGSLPHHRLPSTTALPKA
ncbi:alpha/beta fold hydrolase [Rhizobium laguerreae]|uniref:alpha/beta fold hydrolase n=1 Tax=Rhizobium laguerreae TaxID=1076926 RepID=UPI0035E42F4C